MRKERIYSLNLAAFLASQGHTYELIQDMEKPGKYYFVFETDVSEDKIRYKNDTNLHNYLNMFKKIKAEIYQRRMQEKLS